MSFFPEEQGSELKELFFESASELLQTLNEEGLQLENRAADPEVIRSVRRAVHTLKGDSAACGYRELSGLAHELEDVLTPEAGGQWGSAMAELVLSAADLFEAMLNAYRKNSPLPSGDLLRASIRALNHLNHPAAVSQNHPNQEAPSSQSIAGFEWSEYERVILADALAQGEKIVQVVIAIDENCPMRSAAFQLVRNVLEEVGTILAIQPQEKTENAALIHAALATEFDEQWISRKLQIPAVVKNVLAHSYGAIKTPLEASSSSTANHGASPTLDQKKHPETPVETVLATSPSRHSPEPLTARSAAVTDEAADSILRVDAKRIDTVMNLMGELILGKSMLQQTFTEFDKNFSKHPLRNKFADALAFQARVLTDLQKSVMKIRMVPVEQLFRRFPRLVRDVAKARDREVALDIIGEDTDLDKSILDALAEPLMHLIRNAVDHGIESPAERTAAGKPAQGKLQLKAYHQGNQIVIEISDDGRGIDREKVVAKAIECKVISRADALRLSETEALNLIFHPGLSTAEEVTAISGRGVGMDVVKTVVERLKGSVQIETEIGQGTTFYLKVPLTLAIIQALLFRAAQRLYAVPLASVVEIARSYESEFHRVDHREVLQLRDRLVTLIRLGTLDTKSTGTQSRLFIIVIAFGEQRYGLVVDKLVGEEELVIKALDDQLVATDLVSGASILGDGTVVLVLNISAVIAKLGKPQSIRLAALPKGATA